jgi:hypothetical protein
MGCGCGGKQNLINYKHVAPTGKVTVTRSQVEARARQIREGGTVEKVSQ